MRKHAHSCLQLGLQAVHYRLQRAIGLRLTNRPAFSRGPIPVLLSFIPVLLSFSISKSLYQ